jgi:hypothetical protein
VADESELASNVLEFQRKSFAYDRSLDLDGTRLALFQRTETESESQFRPRILRLLLAVPAEWVVYDPATELLRLGKGGRPGPMPREPGTAVEAAAEAPEFEEAGIAFRRSPLAPGRFLYAPAEWADRLNAPDGRKQLGLPE